MLEETVEVGRLVLRERVQQRIAEQFEDALQFPAEVVEALKQFLDETRHESLSRFLERGRELRVFGVGHSREEGPPSFGCEH